MKTKRKQKWLLFLYIILIINLFIISLPSFTFLIGVNWFCTESLYIIYLGGVTFVNKLYIVVKTCGVVIILFLLIIINSNLYRVTKNYDDNLENNITIIKAYDQYRIDFSSIIPFIIDLAIAYGSYFWVFKKNPNASVIILLLIGFVEIIIVKTTIENAIYFQKFLKSHDNV
ncbi:MAG: hypothetical protein PHO86_01905 [Bacilli bacterium]|nr:hypothetical protein [Bacilli bacterium]